MPQSFVKTYVHIIFGTKYRQKLIHPPFDAELYAYLGGVCKHLDCHPLITGGYRDHVHILCNQSKKIALMDLVEEVKSHSSKWFKTKDRSLRNFYCKNGYAAFSVNPAEIDYVYKYILNQEQHHTRKSFEEEYREFLEQFGVEYDERYMWD